MSDAMDKAWEEFRESSSELQENPWNEEALREAFESGWKARKQATFEAIYGQGSLDEDALDCERVGRLESTEPNVQELPRNDEIEFRCKECHSRDVEHTMWVNVNTDEIGEVYGTWNQLDTSFCNDCEARGCIEEVPEKPPEDETVQEEADREIDCVP